LILPQTHPSLGGIEFHHYTFAVFHRQRTCPKVATGADDGNYDWRIYLLSVAR
jgi:hypothetical protein